MIPYKNEYYIAYPSDERIYPGFGLGGPGSGFGYLSGLGFGAPDIPHPYPVQLPVYPQPPHPIPY